MDYEVLLVHAGFEDVPGPGDARERFFRGVDRSLRSRVDQYLQSHHEFDYETRADIWSDAVCRAIGALENGQYKLTRNGKKTNFDAWFFTIAVNRARTVRDRKRVRKEVALMSAADYAENGRSNSRGGVVSEESLHRHASVGASHLSPLEQLERTEFAERTQAAVKELSPGDQEVYRLRFERDMQYEEIAETLGISLGATKTRIRRTRRRFGQLALRYRLTG